MKYFFSLYEFAVNKHIEHRQHLICNLAHGAAVARQLFIGEP